MVTKIREFMLHFDGVAHYFQGCASVNTWQLGLCDLDYNDKSNELTVTLRRPGLLMGEGGKDIDALEKKLDCKIKIIEKSFGD